jgi:hypothetical protein
MVGLQITVAILGVLRSAIRQVGARLMDAVDPELVDQASNAIQLADGTEHVRELRIRWIGHTLRAKADVEGRPTAQRRRRPRPRPPRRRSPAGIYTETDRRHHSRKPHRRP